MNTPAPRIFPPNPKTLRETYDEFRLTEQEFESIVTQNENQADLRGHSPVMGNFETHYKTCLHTFFACAKKS